MLRYFKTHKLLFVGVLSKIFLVKTLDCQITATSDSPLCCTVKNCKHFIDDLFSASNDNLVLFFCLSQFVGSGLIQRLT